MVHWNYEKPAETEAKFRELLSEPAAVEDRDYRAELLTQIARTHSLRSQFDEAHRLLDQAQPLLSDTYPKSKIRYLLERGRTFRSAKKANEARPLFLEAWTLANAADLDGLAIDAAHMMAIVEPPNQQLPWNLKALRLAEASADPSAEKWLGSLYNNIGWTYFDQKAYADAMAIFEQALTWRKQQGQTRETQIARWCIGRTHRAMGELHKALAIQVSLHQEIEESASKKDGYVYEELAECHLALEQPEALRFFSLAHATLSKDKWLATNEPKRIARLKKLGSL
jgi:tetratricopeptide (TPR) repeat protein